MLGLSMRSRSVLVAAVSVAIAAAVVPGALAQSTQSKDASASAAKPAAGAPVLVVIDAERIRRESLAGKSINAEAEKYDRSFREEAQKDEAPLRATQQELEKLRGKIPPEQFAEKARAFEQRVAEVQRIELKRRQALDKSYNTASYKWQQAMLDAAREVASNRNADAVLQSQALVFYNTGWDVTNEVIDLMNKRVSKIDFPPPKIEPDSPAIAGSAPQEGTAGKPQAKTLQSSQPQEQQQLKLPQ